MCIVQSLFLIIISPLFTGVLRKMKAFLRGYKGPSVLQPYYDIYRLLGKSRVISNNSSFITDIGPLLCLATAISVTFFIPVFYTNAAFGWGNILVVFFGLALIKFMSSLMGLDTASTFGGMGSSREMFISFFGEPILFILILFLYHETKVFNTFYISFLNSKLPIYSVQHIMAAVAFFILVLAENARIPVDNPETHLELTMVHEAMILDMSGPDLALLELSSSIKFMIFLTLGLSLFLPMNMASTMELASIFISLTIYLGKIMIALFVVAIIETSMAKFRLFRVPELLAAAFSIGLTALTINFFL